MNEELKKRVTQGVAVGLALAISLGVGSYLIAAISHYNEASLYGKISETVSVGIETQARPLVKAMESLRHEIEAVSLRLDDTKGNGWPFRDEINSYTISKRNWETDPSLRKIDFPFPNPQDVREMRIK
jgi:hypothetical protein